jgi:hypothetical protein
LPLRIFRIDNAGPGYGQSEQEHSYFRYGNLGEPLRKSVPTGYVIQGCGLLSLLCAFAAFLAGFCGINYRDWRMSIVAFLLCGLFFYICPFSSCIVVSI